MKLLTYLEHSQKTLLIVDVQRGFSKYFNDDYLKALRDHCKNYDTVYQIYDNHPNGKPENLDYLYDDDHKGGAQADLYDFPNEKEKIEKRYLYNVRLSYFKKVLPDEDYKRAHHLASSGKLKKGNMYNTAGGTQIVYVGNNHGWYHVPAKMVEFFKAHKNKSVEIVGGSQGECLEDILVAAIANGVNAKVNNRFVYSAKGPLYY